MRRLKSKAPDKTNPVSPASIPLETRLENRTRKTIAFSECVAFGNAQSHAPTPPPIQIRAIADQGVEQDDFSELAETVKKAFECRDRLLPSITWMFRARNFVRSASFINRSRKLPSAQRREFIEQAA